ncbi:Carboxylic ester hydrolase, partial [Trichostrongylus colubriformis]
LLLTPYCMVYKFVFLCSEQLRDGVGRLIGDYFFTCSLIKFADLIADNVYGPVYMYYFTMRSTANPWPKWMGVMHGYEIEYAFGQPLTRPSLYDKGISEDCLSMNIWVPADHDGSVLVWIFGGGFFSGSPSLDLYDGMALAAKKHTIVVNINYRLGPFGFLYLGDDSPVPGNMGLLDQQLALRWIHENIGSFGGDPTRVTLFGESAGSASATAHIAAPGSYQYFNKIIANSGTIMNSWASRTPDTMLELSLRLAKRLNCTMRGTDASAIHNCLRAAPASVIQVEADSVSSDIGLPMTFAFVPVSADKHFFQGDVFERLRSRNFKKDVAAIIGTVKDEGTYWLPYYMYLHGFWFNHTISAEDPQNKALITREQYRQSMQAFMPYFGNSPLVEHALLHAYESVSEKQSTASTANPWPKWMGVMHGYEIEYAFGQPLTRPSLYDKVSY